MTRFTPTRHAIVAVAAMTVIGGFGSGCDSTSSPAPTSGPGGAVEANATVTYVVDGDTVDVDIDGRDERVRLIGIDTPETKKRDTPIECYGPEASAFTETLLPVGTPVRLVRDTVNRDDFGRLLAYVYRAADGIFVNYEIIRQGFATPLSIEPNTSHADVFVEAARTAERDDVGLWAVCSG